MTPFYLNKLGRYLLDDDINQMSRLGFVISDKNIFIYWVFISKIYFRLCAEQTGTIYTIIEVGHIRTISATFGLNRVSSLGDVIYSNC